MTSESKNISRRTFLKNAGFTSGFLGIKILLPFNIIAAAAEPAKEVVDFKPHILVKFFPDNSIVFQMSKLEMGQGITMGFSMIFADELGADLTQFKTEQADYDPKFNEALQGITGGSGSIQRCWLPLREAGAAVRELFIESANIYWKTTGADLFADDSHIIERRSGTKVKFSELLSIASSRPLPQNVQLKKSSDFKYIGKSLPDLRIKDIVSGKMKFGIDVQIPGMVYAALVRSPAYGGQIESLNEKEALKVPGVEQILRIKQQIRNVHVGVKEVNYDYILPDAAAVIANSTWAAFQGKKLLKVNWHGAKYANLTSDSVKTLFNDRSTAKEIIHADYGVEPASISGKEKLIEAEYEITFQAHAVMEPLNAIASVTENHCEIWTGTQFAQRIAEEASSYLQIPVGNVKVHVLPSGGGFGRRWEADYALEAVVLSHQLKKPVKVVWMREDEIRHDFYHCYEIKKNTARLNARGELIGWEMDTHSFEYDYLLQGNWFNPYAYAIPNQKVKTYRFEAPLPIGPWRSVNEHRDDFSRESFIDEIAFALGKKPIEYRLALLEHPIVVPESIADKEKWVTQAQQSRERWKRVIEFATSHFHLKQGKGIGIALTRYRGDCLTVVEVGVVNGKIRINKIQAFVYCGIAINPSLVKGQITGGIIWAFQAVKYGGIEISNGEVQQRNFHDYKMPRMSEIPPIEVHVIESSDPPLGTGELGVPGLAPALANAIFSATGVRERKIPFKNLG